MNFKILTILIVMGFLCYSCDEKTEHPTKGAFPSLKTYKCDDRTKLRLDSVSWLALKHVHKSVDTIISDSVGCIIGYGRDSSLVFVRDSLLDLYRIYQKSGMQVSILEKVQIESDFDFLKFLYYEGEGNKSIADPKVIELKEMYVPGGYEHGFFEIHGCGFKGFQTGSQSCSDVTIQLFTDKYSVMIRARGFTDAEIDSLLTNLKFW